jgi:hypothetical protein
VKGTLEWLEEAKVLLAKDGLPDKPLLSTGSRVKSAKR